MKDDVERPGKYRKRTERHFKRTVGALQAIFDYVEEVCAAHAIDRARVLDARLAIEELFTNMVKYAPDGASEMSVALAVDGDEMMITLTDFDVDPFDIRQAPAPRLDEPVSVLQPGGLGIHLVRRLMDRIEYRYENRTSTTTLTVRLR